MKVYAVERFVFGRNNKPDDFCDERVFFKNRDDAIMHSGYLYYSLEDNDLSGYVVVHEHDAPDGSMARDYMSLPPRGLSDAAVQTYVREYVDQNDRLDRATFLLEPEETQSNTIF